MHSHGSTLSANYTKISNEMLSRADLSFGAKGLHAYLLVRKGWRRADIKTLSAKFGESQAKITRWFNELAELGYLVRRKVKDTTGRWKTLVMAFALPREVPGMDMSSTTIEALQLVIPDLDLPSLGSSSVSPPGNKKIVKTPPTPEPLPLPEADGRADFSEEKAAGAAVLARIGKDEPRLALGVLEMAPLLPLVAEWLQRGAGASVIRQALSEGLPERVWSPAAFLKDRLLRKMPPPVVRAPRTVAPPMTECADCGRPTAGECSHGAERAVESGAAERRARGIAVARELLAQRRGARSA